MNDSSKNDTTLSQQASFPWHAAAVYLTAAFCLVAGHFLTKTNAWPVAANWLGETLFHEPRLGGVTWWALSSAFFYLVPPLIVSRVVFKKGPRSFGLRLAGLHRHMWIYGVLFVLVLPLVYLSSLRQDFLSTYPFSAYVAMSWRTFLIWEALYIFQFFGLEYFFRGFLLFSLEEEMGWRTVFVMTVPYAMIHFQKPFLEANAAIFAGVILGYAALRTRSFLGGVILHGAVAVTMDVLALMQKNDWPPGNDLFL